MNFTKIFFGFLILFTTQTFAFEVGDYNPSDSNDYYYSGNDNNYSDTSNYSNDSSNYSNNYDTYAQNESLSARYKNRFSSLRKEYVGGGKTFVFDPRRLAWFAYYNGQLINMGRASGGRHFCPDIHRPCRTPVGVFHVSHKGGPDCKSSKYPIGRGNAPMPYCMFFKGGFAIHGSWAVPDFNASHGCIRVPPSDARWLSQAFMSPGTRVIVKSY